MICRWTWPELRLNFGPISEHSSPHRHAGAAGISEEVALCDRGFVGFEAPGKTVQMTVDVGLRAVAARGQEDAVAEAIRLARAGLLVDAPGEDRIDRRFKGNGK